MAKLSNNMRYSLKSYLYLFLTIAGFIVLGIAAYCATLPAFYVLVFVNQTIGIVLMVPSVVLEFALILLLFKYTCYMMDKAVEA